MALGNHLLVGGYVEHLSLKVGLGRDVTSRRVCKATVYNTRTWSSKAPAFLRDFLTLF
jgi:hypothetical protein